MMDAHFNDPIVRFNAEIDERELVGIAVQAANSARASAESAERDARTAHEDAETASRAAASATESADTATRAAQSASRDAGTAGEAKTAAETAQRKAEAAQEAAETAQRKAEDAQSEAEDSETAAKGSAEDSEAWAVGTRNGTPVAQGAPQYENNAAYWADKAEQAAGQAGYMFFYIDEHGHLIYERTSNVDVDFVLENGHLYVEAIA